MQDQIDTHDPGVAARRVCERIGQFRRCLFDLGIISVLILNGKCILIRGLKRGTPDYRSYYGILWIMSFRFETVFGH